MAKRRMVLQGRATGDMNLVGGRLFLDFINTVGARRNFLTHATVGRDDKLKAYLALVARGQPPKRLCEAEVDFLIRESCRLPEESSAVLRRAVRLREAIYQ